MKQNPHHCHTGTTTADGTIKNNTLYKSQACMVPPDTKPIRNDDARPETITETIQKTASSSTTARTSTTTPTKPEPGQMG